MSATGRADGGGGGRVSLISGIRVSRIKSQAEDQ